MLIISKTQGINRIKSQNVRYKIVIISYDCSSGSAVLNSCDISYVGAYSNVSKVFINVKTTHNLYQKFVRNDAILFLTE